MGKGQRARLARAGQKEEFKKIAAKKKRAAKIKKVLGTSVVSLIVLAIVGVIAINIISGTGFFLRNTVSMSTANYKVDNAMMPYFVKTVVSNSQYSQYIDSSKPLSEQQVAEGYSYLDLFLPQAQSFAKEALLGAEAAKAENITLTEQEKAEIESVLAEYKTTAEASGVTLDQFYTLTFGENVKEKDVRRAMELSTLATKFFQDFNDKLDIQEDQYTKHFSENESDYIKADYISYSVPGETEAEIRTNAEIFMNCKTVEEFNKLLKDKFTAQYKAEAVTTNNLASETELTEQQLSDIETKVETELEAARSTLSKPAKDAETVTEINRWLFTEEATTNKTHKIETAADAEKGTKFAITVYIVEKAAYSEDYNLAKARHILFTTEKYSTKQAAKAKAEEILELYKKDATEEKFTELAKQYSDDTSAKTNGGLYEQVTNKEADWPFATWCHTEGRKAGDVEIIESTDGYHIVYYVGQGEVAWKVQAEQAIREEAYTAKIAELEKLYPVTVNQENLTKVKA